jgi:segregation and condensation protein B
MYATTRQFLDYFNLKSLEDLPPLAEIKDLENLSGDLPLEVFSAEISEPEAETDTDREMPVKSTEAGTAPSADTSLDDSTAEAVVLEEAYEEEPPQQSHDSADEILTEGVAEGEVSEDEASIEAPSEQKMTDGNVTTERASDENGVDGELLNEQSPAPAK